jgi:hypothetical protein
MGLHSPFGYVGYGKTFAETIIYLVENFCGGCHSNDDFTGKCKGCPVGQLIYAAKDYISDMYVEKPKKAFIMTPAEAIAVMDKDKVLSHLLNKKASLLQALKKEVKKIEPHPLMLAQWIWEVEKAKDALLPLREAIANIDFIEGRQSNQFVAHGDYMKILTNLADKEYKIAKKKRRK